VGKKMERKGVMRAPRRKWSPIHLNT